MGEKGRSKGDVEGGVISQISQDIAKRFKMFCAPAVVKTHGSETKHFIYKMCAVFPATSDDDILS